MFKGIANLNAQESPSKMIIIRVMEVARGGSSKIVTTDAEGKSSKIELETGLDETGNNAVVIQRELQKWKQEGYNMTQLSTSGELYFHTKVILEK